MQREKQHINNALRVLRRFELHFNIMDKEVPIDPMLDAFEDYLETVSEVDPKYYEIIANTIRKDIIEDRQDPLEMIFKNAFKDLKKNKSIVEVSEIKEIEKQLNKFL